MLSHGTSIHPDLYGHGMNDPDRQAQEASQTGSHLLGRELQYATPMAQHPTLEAGGAINNSAAAHQGGMKLKPNATNGDQAVRRRITRACDQCNQLRTKCDGKQPCAHCDEFGLSCEYARERKKRGKASRKDIAAQQALENETQQEDGGPNSKPFNMVSDNASEASPLTPLSAVKRKRSSEEFPGLSPPTSGGMGSQQSVNLNGGPGFGADQCIPDVNAVSSDLPAPRMPNVTVSDRVAHINMSDYGSIDDYHRSMLHPGASVAGPNILHSGLSPTPNSMMPGMASNNYGGGQFSILSPTSQQGLAPTPYRTGDSPLSLGFLGQSPGPNPSGWPSLPPPSIAPYSTHQQNISNQALRYPVLRPLMPYITSIIPAGLACDLLEFYFSSTSSVFMHPQSPYLLGYVFRKRSFLRQDSPRACSPALLASMLWISAQTSDSAFLTSPPAARGRVCQKLLELTIGLLRPLIHTPSDALVGYSGSTAGNGITSGALGVALPGQAHEVEGGWPGASGALDDVATYLHLATVVSASEYKAASLRWWNAAWTLARELKLNREMPLHSELPGESRLEQDRGDGNAEETVTQTPNTPSRALHDEEREERRRIWWLLFCMDRHLSLCYNKPLFLLDMECAELLQPQDDLVWQAGEFYVDDGSEPNYLRGHGPPLECNRHSIFGYFLPLMTILGEIVELNQARNHPRFGLHFRNDIDWTIQINEISQRLDAYGRSLKEFEDSQSVPTAGSHYPADGTTDTVGANVDDLSHTKHSVGTTQSSQRQREALHQTRVVVAYGTHLMHTLHILLNGKWDPISLLDDNDLWISSQSFLSATAHAVSASEALNEILDYDPDLSFMPFFFGIYLLQGSFLLLLIADKLQGDASPSVVKACETIVRAHEACVVTLSTEYQRNFRKVMRSALAQVRGRIIEDFGEQQKRRREVLALYRWTGDGTGLAL